jgi:hypothetical protein
MKQMIRNGGNGREIQWISKLRWNKWLDMVDWKRNLMNKQIEMKQTIRNGGNDREIGWISKLRWNQWLDMMEISWKYIE